MSWVGNCGRHFVKYFFSKTLWASVLKLATGSSEPVVDKRCDSARADLSIRNGQTYYTIYDPITQQRSGWLSEAEARTWLEQRYYQ